jgi:hypothetical protein
MLLHIKYLVIHHTIKCYFFSHQKNNFGPLIPVMLTWFVSHGTKMASNFQISHIVALFRSSIFTLLKSSIQQLALSIKKGLALYFNSKTCKYIPIQQILR